MLHTVIRRTECTDFKEYSVHNMKKKSKAPTQGVLEADLTTDILDTLLHN